MKRHLTVVNLIAPMTARSTARTVFVMAAPSIRATRTVSAVRSKKSTADSKMNLYYTSPRAD